MQQKKIKQDVVFTLMFIKLTKTNTTRKKLKIRRKLKSETFEICQKKKNAD
jgi:hypothetical protein